MSNPFKDFRHLWSVPKPPPVPMVSQDEIRLEHEQRMALVKDVRVFVSTQAFKDLKDWLDHQIEDNAPNPAHGSDIAACYTFKREGLMVARRRLDTIVRLAEERISDAC